jgi:hypothetical protein
MPIEKGTYATFLSGSDLTNRELFLRKGEDLLARGNLSGARLFFQRAANLGDARRAVGMASTYDA